MSKPVRIVIEAHLDTETLQEIEVIRSLRLDHYRMVLKNPAKTLAALKQNGYDEPLTEQELQQKANQAVEELEARLMEPETIYEDELNMYVETLELHG